MTAAELRRKLMELGVMPRDYDLPLTYERTRGLRLSFLWRMGHVSEPARYGQAARLCGERIAALYAEFAREPEKVHRDWLREA
jgi:hypothetical protein